MSAIDDEKAAKARAAALQGALTQIEREFGKGTVMRLGDEGAQVRVAAIPTGALSLDLFRQVGVLLQVGLGVVAPLTQTLLAIGEERAGLADDVVLEPEVE